MSTCETIPLNLGHINRSNISHYVDSKVLVNLVTGRGSLQIHGWQFLWQWGHAKAELHPSYMFLLCYIGITTCLTSTLFFHGFLIKMVHRNNFPQGWWDCQPSSLRFQSLLFTVVNHSWAGDTCYDSSIMWLNHEKPQVQGQPQSRGATVSKQCSTVHL